MERTTRRPRNRGHQREERGKGKGKKGKREEREKGKPAKHGDWKPSPMENPKRYPNKNQTQTNTNKNLPKVGNLPIGTFIHNGEEKVDGILV